MAGARASGIRDRMAMSFERNQFSFPADLPDSNAGLQYCLQEKKSLEVRFDFLKIFA